MSVMDRLLASDPSTCRQVLRDQADAPADRVTAACERGHEFLVDHLSAAGVAPDARPRDIFDRHERKGEPGRRNTLRAPRLLRWAGA